MLIPPNRQAHVSLAKAECYLDWGTALSDSRQKEQKATLLAKAFEEMAREFPDHPRVPEARYLACVCVELGQEPEQSLPLYEALIKTYPGPKVAGNALLRMGLLRFAGERYKESVKYFTRFLKGFPDHRAADRD